MKDFSSVLVLTNDDQSNLLEALFDLGYIPLIRQRMWPALQEIKHNNVDIAFLDLTCVEIDALEFVINVRDIDQHLPIVIVDGLMEGEKEILNQKNIFVISNQIVQIKHILEKI